MTVLNNSKIVLVAQRLLHIVSEGKANVDLRVQSTKSGIDVSCMNGLSQCYSVLRITTPNAWEEAFSWRMQGPTNWFNGRQWCVKHLADRCVTGSWLLCLILRRSILWSMRS